MEELDGGWVVEEGAIGRGGDVVNHEERSSKPTRGQLAMAEK